jgi:hypothetical protein
MKPPRKLVISGDCTTGGFAACLGRLFEGCEIISFPIVSLAKEEERKRMHLVLRDADVWACRVGLGFDPSPTHEEQRIIKLPHLVFRAFHPDLTYARRRSDGRLVNSPEDYNSSIILWAWQQGLDEQRTARLFTPEVIKDLGFFNAWESSVHFLQTIFEECDLDWRPYLLHAKRLGCFMYSINHPRLPVLMHLAWQIAHKLTDAPLPAELPSTDSMEDALNFSIWPVYPPIAQTYSLPGSYAWKALNTSYPTLSSYITHSFERYQAEKLAPDDIEFGDLCCGRERLSQVLNQAMRRSS